LAILYRHIRIDKNEPFYIGIGDNETRAYNKINRTKHWKSIAKKGYEVEVLLEDLTWEQACEKEKEFIALYGRKDKGTGTLVNMTDGGEGALGRPQTKRLKQKLRESPNKFNLTEWQQLNGAANKGKRLGPQTESRKLKASESLKKTWTLKSKESKDKQTVNFKQNNPNYKIQKCAHCKKEIQGASAFKRFHGNNCKLNNFKLN
jgi:hypothetical protein